MVDLIVQPWWSRRVRERSISRRVVCFLFLNWWFERFDHFLWLTRKTVSLMETSWGGGSGGNGTLMHVSDDGCLWLYNHQHVILTNKWFSKNGVVWEAIIKISKTVWNLYPVTINDNRSSLGIWGFPIHWLQRGWCAWGITGTAR